MGFEPLTPTLSPIGERERTEIAALSSPYPTGVTLTATLSRCPPAA
jgi:hypothetical protein